MKNIFIIFLLLVLFSCKKDSIGDTNSERYCWTCEKYFYTTVTRCTLPVSNGRTFINRTYKCEMTIEEAREFENSQYSSSTTSEKVTNCAFGNGYLVTIHENKTTCTQKY